VPEWKSVWWTLHVWQGYICGVTIILLETYSTILTTPMVLLPQSHDCSYYVSRRHLVPDTWHLLCPHYRKTLIYAHMALRPALSWDIKLGSLKSPAPVAGDCRVNPAVTTHMYVSWSPNAIHHYPSVSYSYLPVTATSNNPCQIFLGRHRIFCGRRHCRIGLFLQSSKKKTYVETTSVRPSVFASVCDFVPGVSD